MTENIPTIDQLSSPAIGPRWPRTGRRRAVLGLLAGAALLAGVVAAYHWWTDWPARIELHAPGDVLPLAFSPDGRTLATTGAEGIILWDVADGRRRATWPCRPGHFLIKGTFTPDGRTFAAAWSLRSSGTLVAFDLIDVDSGNLRGTLPLRNGAYFDLGFRSDGRSLRLLDGGPGGVDVVGCEVATGREISRRTLPISLSYYCPALSPDGRTLAVVPPAAAPSVGPSTQATLWDVDRGQEIARFPDRPGGPEVLGVEFAPDGASLALGRNNGSIELWDIATHRLRAEHRRHTAGLDPYVIRFSPDGSTLASFGRFNREVLTIDTLRIRIARLTHDRDYHRPSELIILDTTTGRHRGNPLEEGIAVLSPDGRTLATRYRPKGQTFDGHMLDIVTRLRTIPGRPRVVAPRRAPGG